MEFVVLLPTLTYDALGRRVEDTGSGVAYDFLYNMDGSKLAVFQCCSLNYLKLSLPLPGGASAVYNWSGLQYYRHPDWLGTTRLATSPGRGVVYDGAVAPFGEAYAQTGNIQGYSFTGQEQEAALDLFDFAFREYHTTQGRWISPDPAGLGAVDPADPQTWNRYAYVRNNPLNAVDPLGLMQSQDTGNDRCTLDGATGTLNCSTLSTWYVVPFISINCASLAQFLLFNGAGGSGLPVGCQGGTPGWQMGPSLNGGGSGGGSAPSAKNGKRPDWLNNITSIFGYDQRIKLPSCAAIAFKTAADDLNPFLPAPADVAQGALNVGQTVKFNQALTYAAAKGLTYPNKSSAFRGILNTSKILGKVSDTLPLVNLDYALTDGLITEIKAMNQGQCQ